ncbi:HAD-IA family hydrolase [Marinovum sp. 2_MG-2023]|uniref:HAD-IA family hydrolase n=1 Tax=unclassified Marinovum TaxID=2647166 RepID=UPI0026E11FC9|nr:MULTISPECIES: HAD-IA family hydrolase [unclassified Marinovum]MDO6728497.1 HAD-IA family hydrolase [Marinovum sp. 2_MG-2023]MDO6778087.1 HAD-IA family hydrolase [Marinovum sp. 1_MG-2023]
MSDLRLVIFDVDGTLVDSQADILAAMQAGFSAVGRRVPPRDMVLSIVGLSLDVAIARLAPDASDADVAAMVAAYKTAYVAQQASDAAAPLYPGVQQVLDKIGQQENWLLGVATGKSRRGLTAVLTTHGLGNVFVTEQVSDFHPSKPHPAMLQAALDETGVAAADAVMVGDTSYDMDMAKAAGITGIGVSWGYHPRSALKSADLILDDMAELPAVLAQKWGANG